MKNNKSALKQGLMRCHECGKVAKIGESKICERCNSVSGGIKGREGGRSADSAAAAGEKRPKALRSLKNALHGYLAK